MTAPSSEVYVEPQRALRTEAEVARLRTALRESERRYQTLFSSIDEGFCIIEMLFDFDGKPSDYRFIEINPAFEQLTGLAQALGKTARELVPDLEQRWFDIYGNVAKTGTPARFVEHSLQMARWFDVYAFRVTDGPRPKVAIRFTNVTQHKLSDLALQESRLRLRTAMDAAQMYSWEMNLTTQRVDWSSNQKDVLGFSLPERVSQTVELLHADDRAAFTGAVLRAIELDQTFAGDCRIVNPDTGEIVWGAWQGVAVSGAADGHTRFVGITQNVTARKRAEEALVASNERLRMLVNQSNAGIVEYDLQGRITLANQRYCQITAYSEAELLQKTVHEIAHPDHLQESAEQFDRLAAGGEDYVLEHRTLRKDGAQVWVSHSFAGMRDADGHVRSIMAVALDVTVRRDAEQAQRQADVRKDEFLAILAHELRNPLAPIRNAAQIMHLVDPQQAQLKSAISVIERQARYLTRLVDDLLDISRINMGKIDLRTERIDVGSVVLSALETSQPAIDAAHHRLVISVPEDPVFVQADAVRLAQVLSNLLNNAARYTEHGGHIQVTAQRQAGQVAISIKDTGVGIEPQMLPHVFQMFVQVDRSLERSRSGLGIGLALAQRIVEMHGGTLEAHSSGVAGAGSEFIVRLPISREQAPAPASSGAAVEDASKGRAANGKRRILVADDNEDSVESLAMLLSIDGNEVRTALDGRAAVDAMSGFDPELVVLDLGMPKLNGYDAAREIRKRSPNKDIVLIALTGWGQEDVKRRCEEAGFNGHLVKPADYAALKRLIADLPHAPSA